jgi:hypothetical protein
MTWSTVFFWLILTGHSYPLVQMQLLLARFAPPFFLEFSKIRRASPR